jgi:hypothetical protein
VSAVDKPGRYTEQDNSRRRVDGATAHWGMREIADGRPEIRTSQEDRSRAVAALQRHYVDGRLTETELGERVKLALAARTYGELDSLFRDLPVLSESAVPASGREQDSGDPRTGVDPASGAPVKGVRQDREFQAHFTSYVLVMLLLVAIWFLTTPGGYFWPIWPMLGWGIGVASHGLGYSKGCGSVKRAGADGPRPRS